MTSDLTDRIADVITEASQRYFHSIPRGYPQYVAAAVVEELKAMGIPLINHGPCTSPTHQEWANGPP